MKKKFTPKIPLGDLRFDKPAPTNENIKPNVNSNNNEDVILRVKRKRGEEPLEEIVVERPQKVQKLSLLQAFSQLSTKETQQTTGKKRKLYRLEETVEYDENEANIIDTEQLRKKRKTNNEIDESVANEFVVDIYKVDVNIKEEALSEIPSDEVVFLESSEYLAEHEYDSDFDTEDENDENYYGNDYPEDLSSSTCSENSSNEDDRAYFSDYQEYDDY